MTNGEGHGERWDSSGRAGPSEMVGKTQKMQEGKYEYMTRDNGTFVFDSSVYYTNTKHGKAHQKYVKEIYNRDLSGMVGHY